jgi:hypothetical protein
MVHALIIGTAAVALAAGASAPTPAEPAARATCGPTQAAGIASEFFAAFNRGDVRRAVDIMDPRAGPRDIRPRGWYSLSETDSRGPGRQHAFYRRAALMRYFARRHAHHERLRLVTMLVGARDGRADFEFRVRRTADDLRSIGIAKNRFASGKGALFCARRKIFVWSMVHPDERVTGPTCPGRKLACPRRP